MVMKISINSRISSYNCEKRHSQHVYPLNAGVGQVVDWMRNYQFPFKSCRQFTSVVDMLTQKNKHNIQAHAILEDHFSPSRRLSSIDMIVARYLMELLDTGRYL